MTFMDIHRRKGMVEDLNYGHGDVLSNHYDACFLRL